MANRTNRPHFFADVVSVEAWLSDFDGETGEADLFTYVTFDEARVGGGNEAPIRFRLGIKRAEIHIFFAEIEPAEILPETVAREQRRKTFQKVVNERTIEDGSKGNFHVSQSGVKAKLGTTSDNRERQQIERTEIVFDFIVKYKKMNQENGCRWDVCNSSGGVMIGPPWNDTERRMRIRDIREGGKRKIEPVARVAVYCRQEDLEITEPKYLRRNMKWKSIHSAKRAVVIEYIKRQLVDMSLPCEDVEDPFGSLCFANVPTGK